MLRKIVAYFRTAPHQIAMFLIIIIFFTGFWLFITPFYNFVVESFNVNPIASVIVGALIVFVSIRLFKLHPW